MVKLNRHRPPRSCSAPSMLWRLLQYRSQFFVNVHSAVSRKLHKCVTESQTHLIMIRVFFPNVFTIAYVFNSSQSMALRGLTIGHLPHLLHHACGSPEVIFLRVIFSPCLEPSTEISKVQQLL